ncbi:MAG: disulfide bond formation protein DsbA [Firmicutes bacterium HGW-Firmicutes-7]|nr:MAG: disulfide bond formation protein DsbA [Firmicutes bacterium HGW-Firmicutes-7]
MKIEIYSDFVCPFCYMGVKRLEAALAQFEHNDEVEITYKSFQLDTNAKRHPDKDIHQLIAEKYNMSYEESKANNENIVKAAAEVGLSYRFDILKPNNTAMAHQIAQYAKSVGKEGELVHRFYKGYFEEGADIGDKETLLSLAQEVGLDRNEAEIMLNEKTFVSATLKDQADAEAIWIDFVPYFIADGKHSISGAQSIESMLRFLNEAYQS